MWSGNYIELNERNLNVIKGGACGYETWNHNWYNWHYVAGPGGFEPPTTGLGGRRSILAELRALPGPHMWLGYVGEA